MIAPESLILPLLQGFFWFDDGLQAHLQAHGWTEVTRPESMVMTNVVIGVQKPSEIARNLGVSRQSVHATINQMVEKGILELADDPEDGRAKIVVLSEVGQQMRQDANQVIQRPDARGDQADRQQLAARVRRPQIAEAKRRDDQNGSVEGLDRRPALDRHKPKRAEQQDECE